MNDPTVWSWTHPHNLTNVTPILVAATSFYAGAVIWLHAWRTR